MNIYLFFLFYSKALSAVFLISWPSSICSSSTTLALLAKKSSPLSLDEDDYFLLLSCGRNLLKFSLVFLLKKMTDEAIFGFYGRSFLNVIGCWFWLEKTVTFSVNLLGSSTYYLITLPIDYNRPKPSPPLFIGELTGWIVDLYITFSGLGGWVKTGWFTTLKGGLTGDWGALKITLWWRGLLLEYDGDVVWNEGWCMTFLLLLKYCYDRL